MSTTRYKVATEQLHSKIGTEGIILDLRSESYYSLNETGNRIWQRLQQPNSIEEILNYLLDEYEITREQCSEDIQAFLKEMLQVGLIEIVNEKAV